MREIETKAATSPVLWARRGRRPSHAGKREETVSKDCKAVGGNKDKSRQNSDPGPVVEPESNSVSVT